MTKLDCHSYQSTLESFARIHRADTKGVINFIKEQYPDRLERICKQKGQSWNKLLYSRCTSTFSNPQEWQETYWFHATRLCRNHTIWKDGLLPLSMMRKKFRTQIKELTKNDIKNVQWNKLVSKIKSNFQYSCRLSNSQDGPYAFLIFENLQLYTNQISDNRNYLQGSEFIEAICTSIGGSLGNELFAKYKSLTTPSVVKFSAPSAGYEMETALRYLWYKEWIPEELGGSHQNTCFNGKGITIMANKIEEIIKI